MIRFVFVLFLCALISGCEEDRLVKVDCVSGEQVVCDESNLNFSEADPTDPPFRTGQCSFGIRTCTSNKWGS